MANSDYVRDILAKLEKDGATNRIAEAFEWSLRFHRFSKEFREYYEGVDPATGALALDMLFSSVATGLGELSVLVDANAELGPEMTQVIHREQFARGREAGVPK